MIQFLLNNQLVTEEALDPNLTILNYLRGHLRRTGTKEGCASGDCGACSVTLGKAVNGAMQYETVNSCLTLVSTLQGKQLITVEDLRHGGALHPAQQAMVDCHGSQCGFCTPGFVMSLFSLQKSVSGWDRHQAESALAGNLCRCTGYRPIMAAAQQLCSQPVSDPFDHHAASVAQRLTALANQEMQQLSGDGRHCYLPKTPAQLAQIYLEHPEARLIAGGTDLSLTITQQHQRIPVLIALEQVAALKVCSEFDDHYLLGASASLQQVAEFLTDRIPGISEMLQRFASLQIRLQGTLGGNIANASPIGDASPMLLALNATLLLQQGEQQRLLPLDQFFTGYRQTRLLPGEFIRAIRIDKVTVSPDFVAWKVSKRLDDDISAVFAAFNLEIEQGQVRAARIAFGGMAATPKRATHCEQALLDQPFNAVTVSRAAAALAEDFQPLSDFRASADYRLQVARNLLRRYYHRYNGELTCIEVARYVS
ncbi:MULTISPECIES: xanthine dehydrogenase small subunit [Pantoea]|jgi:xanthine dehydrogenase small subunit|uniref:xanthine dehydrogenase small subunit n=1 Tax=Pantoea TaxID=53335 RepID=UPI001F3579C1|nr:MULTISPECIES: xanthine dehydrogenase small subunit [Pantoea]UIL50670.1 xanthine dehydrogenase small subunit [Pantoea agglomerans]